MAETDLAERVAKVEGILEENQERFNHLQSDIRDLGLTLSSFRKETDERFEALRREMDNKFEALRKEMRSQFLWMLGILIPMWVTIILTILIKA